MADPITGALVAGGTAKLFGATTAIALGGAAAAGAGVGLGVAARDRRLQEAAQQRVTQQQEFQVQREQQAAQALQQREQQQQATADRSRRAQLRGSLQARPSLFNILGTAQAGRSTLG